jgi:hypothetical protein
MNRIMVPFVDPTKAPSLQEKSAMGSGVRALWGQGWARLPPPTLGRSTATTGPGLSLLERPRPAGHRAPGDRARSHSELQEPVRGREIDESRARRDVEFALDARSVPFGRSHGEVEAFGDFPVCVTARE